MINKLKKTFLTAFGTPNLSIYAIVMLGAILNLLFIMPSIMWGCEGAAKCGLWIGEWHYHDALWHIAVSRVSFQSWPFGFPSASGFLLTSYNYLLGLILYLLELIRVDAFFSYFYLLPILSNIIFAFALFRYLKLTKKSSSESRWIAFFTYFCGSFSYLLLYKYSFYDYSILKAFPVAATLQPAFVLSNIQFFIAASLFIYLLTDMVVGKVSWKNTLVQTAILSIGIGLKIYTSLFALLILTIGYIYWALRKKSAIYLVHIALIMFVSFICYLVLYLPFNSQVKGVPFGLSVAAIPHVLTESPGLFYNKDFTLGRYYMIGLGKLSLRLVVYELISIALFAALNLGTRILFVFHIIKRRLNLEDVLLLLITVSGFTIPSLFVQKSGGWYNSIQFAYISIYTSGIISALVIARFSKHVNKVVVAIATVLVVVLSIPNSILSLKFLAKERILISYSELNALKHFEKLPFGVVLSLPDTKNSSYVPSLSRKVAYLIDDEQASLMNLPVADRRKRIDARDCSLLSEVKYIYLNNSNGEEFLKCEIAKNEFQEIYSSGSVRIYLRVNSFSKS